MIYMAWLSGWLYRKSHLISHAADAGTNYQIKITIHYGSGIDSAGDIYTNSHCKTDFGDIRFTTDDGITLLDHWMQSKVDSNNAVFWVEVSGDLSTIDKTIYVYYGYPSATTASNFDNTFIFGDPFDNATLDASRWTSVDGSPTYTIDPVNHYLEVTAMAASNWWNGKGFHSKVLTFPDTYILEDAYAATGQKISHYSTAIGEIFGAIFSIAHTTLGTDNGVAFSYICDSWASSANYSKGAGVGGTGDYDSGVISGSTSTWYNLLTRIWKLAGNIHVELDGTERVNESNSETPNIIHLGISTYTTYGFGTERFYAFKIRKYVSPEPLNSTWGPEESPIVQWTLTVASDHDTPSPTVGGHLYDDGTLVACSVTSPVTEGSVSYTCTGWTGTGSVPSSGSNTSMTFTITQDSTITWNWIVTPTPSGQVFKGWKAKILIGELEVGCCSNISVEIKENVEEYYGIERTTPFTMITEGTEEITGSLKHLWVNTYYLRLLGIGAVPFAWSNNVSFNLIIESSTDPSSPVLYLYNCRFNKARINIPVSGWIDEEYDFMALSTEADISPPAPGFINITSPIICSCEVVTGFGELDVNIWSSYDAILPSTDFYIYIESIFDGTTSSEDLYLYIYSTYDTDLGPTDLSLDIYTSYEYEVT